MGIKWVGVIIILFVFSFAGWEILNLRSGRNPNVLAVTTTRTLEERVKSLETRVYLLEKSAGLVPVATGKSVEKFVQLSGGSVSGGEWTKIPGTDFTLDTALYGKNVEVSWQGWIDGGYGSVRLYDNTNHRAVDFSEFTATSEVKTSFYTKVMSIWRGQNQYFIEAKNPAGEITVTSPRLKVVVR